MAYVSANNQGNAFKEIMCSGAMEPGEQPTYEVAKILYLHHPVAHKLARAPLVVAQSQQREIEVVGQPDDVKKAFVKEWLKIGANKNILNFGSLARVYGIASIALLQEGVHPSKPIDFVNLFKQKIKISVFDPLNTSGSLVLNQNPLAFDFQGVGDIAVNGVVFHRSRQCVLMHGDPVYIQYQMSGYGFVGQSVFQRAIFPLKSYLNTLVTNDMIVTKAGVLVTIMKQVGSIIDVATSMLFGAKRSILKEAQTGNVISIGEGEAIESIDLKNLEGPYRLARENIIKDIASGSDTPAVFLAEETLTQGFGEGTEDAKKVAGFIDSLREWLEPAYEFFDRVVQHRAWNPEFYEALKNKYPEEFEKYPDHNTWFWECRNNFQAPWPSLLREPDSERSKTDKVVLDGLIEAFSALLPALPDPANKAILVQWVSDNLSSLKTLFPFPLEVDAAALAEYEPPGIGHNGGPEMGEEEQGAGGHSKLQDDTIAEVSLNGAQVTAILDVINQVGAGTLPMAAALNIITTAFRIDLARARKMLTGVVEGANKQESDTQPSQALKGVK